MIFFLLSFQCVLHAAAAAFFTKICPLNNAPVPLEYDEATGKYSLIESSTEMKEDGGGDITADEEVRLLKRTVRVAGSERKRRHLRARREEVKRVYMARSCPCGNEETTYCLVEGLSGSAHDTCGLSYSSLTLFSNITTSYSGTKVECFKLESHTVFIRNAWPVIVFWYLALAVFLIATDNGRHVRQYILSKLCPRCKINERRLDSIVQREIENRERIARLADGRGRYLLRARGMRVPNNDGMTAGDEAMRRWIAQAESFGILHTPRPTEYVLQTRNFNARQELKRREKARLEKANVENEDGEYAGDAPSTPTKKSTKKDNVSTPETIASCDDDAIEEGSESEEPDVPNKHLDTYEQEIMEVDELKQSEEDEHFDCTICLAPVEDGEKVGVLPCSHIFHAECLGQWIQRRNVCPLCQAAEIAQTRAIEEEEETGNDAGVDAVDDRVSAGAPSASDNNMLLATPPTPIRTQRSRQRLQLQFGS